MATNLTTPPTVLSGSEDHDEVSAKILAMVVLGTGSFLTGLLPIAVSDNTTRRFPFQTSLLLCFGAGVLLATSLVHLLPDVRKMMPEYAEVTFCGGFFIVYFLDELIQCIFGDVGHSHSHESVPSEQDAGGSARHQNYGSNEETESLLHNHDHEVRAPPELCDETLTGTLGLLVALSIHSLVEGLTIGVQTSQREVLFLLFAVSCHKFVMGFSLGLEVRSNVKFNKKSQIAAVALFSLGSVIGIGAGMGLVEIPMSWTKSAIPILQGLSGGTLLYVTVCEVIPREKGKWHRVAGRRTAGLAQFLVLGIGFAAMTLINFYLDDD